MRRTRDVADPVKRIAMWSGPRNISTALMRSFENRSDTAVVDEPFYAYYLSETGIDHPCRDEVIASQESDWRKVAAAMVGPAPGGAAVFYQKQMTHHCLPEMLDDWMDQLTHVFLIRDPAEIVASYRQRREEVTPVDLGIHRQREIRDFVADRTGSMPIVIDGNDILKDPARMLSALCQRLGIGFDPAMLSWPAGPRDSDGVWAPHWYDNVLRSTGFHPYKERKTELTPELAAVADACREPFDAMSRDKLQS